MCVRPDQACAWQRGIYTLCRKVRPLTYPWVFVFPDRLYLESLSRQVMLRKPIRERLSTGITSCTHDTAMCIWIVNRHLFLVSFVLLYTLKSLLWGFILILKRKDIYLKKTTVKLTKTQDRYAIHAPCNGLFRYLSLDQSKTPYLDHHGRHIQCRKFNSCWILSKLWPNCVFFPIDKFFHSPSTSLLYLSHYCFY